MSIFEILRVAVRALRRNKTRSFLTTLGMVIGVGAVIAMVSMGEGAKANVEKAFASMGSNVVIVMPGSTTAGGMHGGFGSMPTLTFDDLKAIQTEVPTVRYAAPGLRSNAQLISEDQNWSTAVQGTSPDFFAIRNWSADKGDLFTTSDVDTGNKVVVLGATVVEKLFGPDVSPVGRSIRIKNVPFTVVGVLDKKGQSPMGQDYDDTAIVPYTTFQARIQGSLGRYLQGVILLSAVSGDATTAAQHQVSALLRDRHHLADGADDDFSIRNLAEIANAQQAGANTMSMLLAGIAAVSLLVGGIGIMNIMLVSVTERTREIGIRMAIGARPRDILAQFLIEALTLAVTGGVLGVALGLAVAGRLASSFGWPLLIKPDIVLISVLFSGLVGVIFGLYPARKASLLDPIDALRYE
jgi:putative ABC transport system permease protein